MEILLFVLSIPVSGGIGYVLGLHFQNKAHAERPDWFTLDGITTLITENPGKIEWNPKQLIELYNQTVYGQGPNEMPYKVCPNCGSANLALSGAQNPRTGDAHFMTDCNDCSWSAVD